MLAEAASTGKYISKLWGEYPRINIVTVEQLLRRDPLKLPTAYGSYKQDERVKDDGPTTRPMFPDDV